MREHLVRLTCALRSSEEQLSHAYHLLKTQLTQDHAEIRLSAFQIVDELFTRSHQFRVLLVSDFQEFLELTLGTDNEHPLPPPREAAQRLKQAAMQAVEGWNEKFGEAYKKLALGYHFLKHIKKVSESWAGQSAFLWWEGALFIEGLAACTALGRQDSWISLQ